MTATIVVMMLAAGLVVLVLVVVGGNRRPWVAVVKPPYKEAPYEDREQHSCELGGAVVVVTRTLPFDHGFEEGW